MGRLTHLGRHGGLRKFGPQYREQYFVFQDIFSHSFYNKVFKLYSKDSLWYPHIGLNFIELLTTWGTMVNFAISANLSFI